MISRKFLHPPLHFLWLGSTYEIKQTWPRYWWCSSDPKWGSNNLRTFEWIDFHGFFFNLSIQGADYNGDFHTDVEYLLAGSSNWAAGPSLPVKVRGPGATTTSGPEYLCKYSKYLSNCYPCFHPESTIFVCGSDLAQTTRYSSNQSKLSFDSSLKWPYF